MKRSIIIYIVSFLFCLFVAADLSAQGRHNRGRGNKEYVGHHNDRKKLYKHHAKNRDKSYHAYYKNREKAYRKYIKDHGKRYRDHDAWYYNKRFHNRKGYVYFPEYRTYYDPYRRHYVYRQNSWVYSSIMPSFMVGLNVGGLAIQFMGDLPIR